VRGCGDQRGKPRRQQTENRREKRMVGPLCQDFAAFAGVSTAFTAMPPLRPAQQTTPAALHGP